MNLSHQTISSYLNIPTEDLIDMENGDKKITLSLLNKLCSLFGYSESYLLCRCDDYDLTKFPIRNSSLDSDDLDGIASMNRIYMNMQYLICKMNELT